MDEHTPPESRRLTAEEVSSRVGAILSDAEREAREIIASARQGAESHSHTASLEDLTRTLERLGTRLDAFELSTAAQIEELGRRLTEVLANLAPAAVALPPAQAPPVPRRDSADMAAARVRAIDLAIAGYGRERIASELSSSLPREDVDTLLDEILVS